MPAFELHEAFREKEKEAPSSSSTAGGPTSEELGADGYKKKGNQAFQAGDWDEAIKFYNKAITLDPSQAAFYSNRAACWSSKGKHDAALADAERCLKTDAKFIKGYSRKGKALFDLSRLDEAEAAYNEGLKLDAANEACSNGLSVVRAARAAQASRSQRSSAPSSSSSASAASRAAGFMQSFAAKLKSGGMGMKLKFYAVMLVGYFLYSNLMGKSGKKRSSSSSFESSAEEDDYGAARATGGIQAAGHLRRAFSEVRSGAWISYLEVPASSEMQFLLLHGTGSSSAADFSGLLGAFAAGGSAESPGLGFLAPDRPCHGYSPCAAGAQGASIAWLNALLASRRTASRLAVVANGPTAARQALALAKRRKEVEHLLLINHRSAGPSRKGASLGTPLDVSKWLQTQAFNDIGGSSTSAALAADAAWWATRGGSEKAPESDDALDVSSLPDRCAVTAFYGDSTSEDEELKSALEEQGVTATMRDYGSRDVMLEELIAELQHISGASDSSSSADDGAPEDAATEET